MEAKAPAFYLKKLTHIILILLLILQTGGIVLYYQGQQHQWRKHMVSVLANEKIKLGTFTLTLQEYERSKAGENELCLNGKMYDLKSATINGEEVIVTAIQDTKEDDIVHRIKKIITGGKHGSHIPRPLIELLALYYILPPASELHFYNESHSHRFYTFSDKVFSRNNDIYVPPPRKA
ncbi:MAG: hypothetical protein K0Q79_2901 [Flavipsychrobacter sp.]|nr:hypothetical protein [Flavipsychrobacter sp.]